MKIVKAMLVSMFVLSIANSAGAMNFDVKNIKGFGQLDMFTVGTANSRLKHQLKDMKSVGDIGSYAVTGDAAYGFRVGALYPVENVADVGLSWGYIAGPNAQLKMDGISKYYDITRRFFRMMVEAQKTMKINDKFSYMGGAGLGVAWGKQEYQVKYEYAMVQNGVVLDTADQNFHGLTWELSAGVNYKATDKLNVDLGVRYAGFPHARNTTDHVTGSGEISGMDWRSFGIFTGVHF